MSDSERVIEIHWNPSARELQQFGRYWFPLFYAVVGGLAWWKYGAPRVGCGIWGTGVFLSLIGFAFPVLIRFIFVGMSVVTYPLGWVVSHLVLGLIFYGVVLPIGLALRLCGHDPLQRKLDPSAKSYWVPHKPPADSRRYFRQW